MGVRAIVGGMLIAAALGTSACASGAALQQQNRTRLGALQVGMGRVGVLQHMGYATARSDFRVVKNPYHVDRYTVPHHRIEVLWYLTGTKQEGDGIAPDEVTPVVLVDGRLAGWGWPFWRELVQTHGIATEPLPS